MAEPFDAFDTWWTEHYSMANLARGAAEAAWKAATERAAKIAETPTRELTHPERMVPMHVDGEFIGMYKEGAIYRIGGPKQIAAAIRRGTP